MATSKSVFPAMVVKVLADDKVVINRGANDGIVPGQRYVLYQVDPEILVDPASGEELGTLETPKGEGVINYVQDRMSVLYNARSIFNDPQVGDLVKPV